MEVLMPLDVFFRKDKDYRVVPVSGVWGGISPHGMIFADFFFEKPDTPEKVTLDDSGKEVGRSPSGMFVVRDVVGGITVRPEVARAIGQWFIDKADEFEKKHPPTG
jgi:hypothetical protein